MMDCAQRDISEIVIRFLETLPSTIRNEIFLSVLGYALDMDEVEAESELGHEGLLPAIIESIRSVRGARPINAIIRIVAATDYSLERIAHKIRQSEILIRNAPSTHPGLLRPELCDRLLTTFPMRRKHADAALSEWKKLRSTSITQQTLSNYEDALAFDRVSAGRLRQAGR